MGRYGLWYAGGSVALLVTQALSVSIPVEVARAIDALGSADGGQVALASAGRVAAMGAAVILIRTLSRILYFTPGRLIEAELKRDLFHAVLRQQPAWLAEHTPGDLFSRINNDVSNLRVFAGFGTLAVANLIVAVSLAGGSMVRIHPTLAVLLLLPTLGASAIVQVLVRRMFVLIRQMQEQTGQISQFVLATLRGMATVQGYVAEPAFLGRFDAINDALAATSIRRAQLRAAMAPTLTLSTSLNLLVLLGVGGPRVLAGELSLGELIALTSLVAMTAGPLRASSFLISVAQSARASLERIDHVLDAPVDRPDRDAPHAVPQTPPRVEVRGLTLTLSAAEGAKPALRDVSFTLPAGGTLGVFGPTGAGKSTLLRALTRLIDPPPGTILIDGVDVRSLDLDAWRRAVSYVTQRPVLFSESLRDNLLLGDQGPDAPARLATAIEAGELGPDVARLPQGVDTVVGEAGVRLSGGQRQRAALARALLRPHRVLLLDDTLSAVDHHTEARLIERLRARAGQVTTILVAHRVSALLHCDAIVVLDHGRVVDVGSPHDLSQRPGLFRDTLRQQQAQPAPEATS
jgi:ATP-binding cassette subfamily B protein